MRDNSVFLDSCKARGFKDRMNVGLFGCNSVFSQLSLYLFKKFLKTSLLVFGENTFKRKSFPNRI